jgi:nucleoside-diphosphate-sugar epimerase
MKKILIVGGTGYIGGAITEKLKASYFNFDVISVGRSELNVINLDSISEFYDNNVKGEIFDAIIYSVGNCPPYGFIEEVKNPLLILNPDKLNEDFNLHVTGLLRVVQMMKNNFSFNAKVLVISSGITQVPDETCPPTLFAGHYAAVKSAQDELVKWFNRDPFFIERGIFIKSLKLRAVDTPFHWKEPEELKSPFMMSLNDSSDLVLNELK